MKTETYSITASDDINIHIGQTTIYGVPNLGIAEKFIELARHRWPDGDGILNNDSNTVSLIGGILVEALIAELR